MAKGMDMSDVGKYAGLGAGAVIVPMLAAKATFLAPVLSNQIMNFGFSGITVGMIVLAGLGVFGADKIMGN